MKWSTLSHSKRNAIVHKHVFKGDFARACGGTPDAEGYCGWCRQIVDPDTLVVAFYLPLRLSAKSRIDMDEQAQDKFHRYLASIGYQVPRDSQVFQALADLYVSGEWGEMVETEFAPVWAWNAKAEALLAPFMKVSIE